MYKETAFEEHKRNNGFITNFKDGFLPRARFRKAALITGAHIWFSDEATDCHGRSLSDIGFPGRAALYSSTRDLSRFWRIARLISNPRRAS